MTYRVLWRNSRTSGWPIFYFFICEIIQTLGRGCERLSYLRERHQSEFNNAHTHFDHVFNSTRCPNAAELSKTSSKGSCWAPEAHTPRQNGQTGPRKILSLKLQRWQGDHICIPSCVPLATADWIGRGRWTLGPSFFRLINSLWGFALWLPIRILQVPFPNRLSAELELWTCLESQQ